MVANVGSCCQLGVCFTSPVPCLHAQCNDIYFPRSSRQGHVDGAYFGTTFPHLFFMTFSALVPPPPTMVYVPRVFGFKVYKEDRPEPVSSGRQLALVCMHAEADRRRRATDAAGADDDKDDADLAGGAAATGVGVGAGAGAFGGDVDDAAAAVAATKVSDRKESDPGDDGGDDDAPAGGDGEAGDGEVSAKVPE